MPALTASQEMKEVAIADEPKKETTYYGHTYTTRTYFAFMNCLVQDGVLKAAFFLPDHLRLDGNNPAYEVFIDKENRQFLTYDHLEKMRPWFKTIFPASAVAISAFSTFRGM